MAPPANDPATLAERLLHAMVCGSALVRVRAAGEAERLGLAGICVEDSACPLRDGRPCLWPLGRFLAHLAKTDSTLAARQTGRPLHTPDNVRLGTWQAREDGTAW